MKKKTYNCEDLRGSVYFAPNVLRHCCQRFFVKGKMQGQGIYHFDNKQRYDGEWYQGKREGTGILYSDTDTIIKQGWWKDNEYQDYGEDELCIICYANKKCMAFVPCGHLCICEGCSDKYEDDKCIVCRKEFAIPHKIYT